MTIKSVNAILSFSQIHMYSVPELDMLNGSALPGLKNFPGRIMVVLKCSINEVELRYTSCTQSMKAGFNVD